MYTWWECFQENKHLFILTVHDENKNLIGIAPLCIDKKKIGGITVLHYLRFLGTMPISSDHLDFILSQGRERETLETIVNYLFQENKWDLCLLSNIPISSLTGKLLREIMGNRPFQSEISEGCSYITLPTRNEDFHASLSGKMRNTIKRRRRNLHKEYDGFEFVTWENQDKIDSAMEKMFELHEKRWMVVKHRGNFVRNDVRTFHKRIARIFLESDMLRLYFLRVQGKDVAALYAFKYNNKICYYQSGRDPDWSKEGVGSVLKSLIIEDAINKGYLEFDFLRGEEDYKTEFTDQKRIELNIFISNSFNAKIYLLFRNLYHKIKGYGNNENIKIP